jgi:hypothetical protein
LLLPGSFYVILLGDVDQLLKTPDSGVVALLSLEQTEAKNQLQCNDGA